MAKHKPSTVLIFLNALALLVPIVAFAQGNDFPPIGNIPPWGPPPQPGFPPPPGNNNWTSGSFGWQTLGVRKGDTIGFDVVVDGWGLGALYLAPMCSNCTSMRYLPPTDGSAQPSEQWWWGQLGTWCQRCGWEAVAGENNPTIGLDYTSQKGLWFSSYLEWRYTTPRPSFASWFRVLTDPSKSEAQGISNFLAGAAGVWTGAGIGFLPDLRLSAVFQAMGYIGGSLSSLYSGWARDPFDWNYCSPVGWDYDWQAYNDLAWTWPYTDDSQTYLPLSGWIMISLGNAVQVAIDRALSAAQVADWGDSSAEQCAWDRRAEAHYYIHEIGNWMWYFRWSVEVTADAFQAAGYDPNWIYWGIYGCLHSLGYAASWSQGVQ